MNPADGRRQVPPQVTGALWPLDPGGGWEGGTVDRDGRRWIHHPWQGWQPDPRPPLAGRVYTARRRRRARYARRALLLLVLCAAAAVWWWAR